MTLLCVPIFVETLEQGMRDVAEAAERGAEIVELRIDTFTDVPLVQSLIASSTVPVILTCRGAAEGGQSELGDIERAELLLAAGGEARYLDFELASLRRLDDATRGRLAPRLIASSHDFAGFPPQFHALLERLHTAPAAVSKLAWRARSVRDNLDALEILTQRPRTTIALCMGEMGLPSRVLAKKFGGFLTFASLRGGAETAPGQPSVEELKRLYRWDAIGRETRVFGVVGDPVGHSMSPAIHNAAFDATGYDGVYLPLPVEKSYESFKAFAASFIAMESLHLRGMSITIPHKENALQFVLEAGGSVDDLSRQIGAINTIRIDVGGATVGTNTDYAAILDCVAEDRSTLAGKRVAILGAGGTARAAVAGFVAAGAVVTVHNRTLERASSLVESLGVDAAVESLETLAGREYDVIFNTTSLGMSPQLDASVFDLAMPMLRAETIVFDAIYNPLETKLLRQSREAGARTIGGLEMFLKQAAGQFEWWTGLNAPVSVMRDVVVARLI